MKIILLKNLNLVGGILIGLSLPFGSVIISRSLDALFIVPGIICMIISYHYTFKNNNHG